METLSKQDSSPATGCLRMWEPMCSSGQGLLHSSIVKSLARDVAGFSRPVRWYSEPLQLTHISVEGANLVPGLFPQDLAGHPFPLAHLEKVFPPLCQQYLEALPPHTRTREDRGDTGGDSALSSSWKAVFLHGLQPNTHLECAKRSPQEI